MRLIRLGIKATTHKGFVALVDDEDYDDLSMYAWQANWSEGMHSYYAVRMEQIGKGKQKTIYMARHIMNTPKGMDTDHINKNTLDNRRFNLRICTRQQNQCNSRNTRGSTSEYKGVSWKNQHQKWVVQIGIKRERKHIGYFDKEIDAARAYDEAAKKYHGSFAGLNFKEE